MLSNHDFQGRWLFFLDPIYFWTQNFSWVSAYSTPKNSPNIFLDLNFFRLKFVSLVQLIYPSVALQAKLVICYFSRMMYCKFLKLVLQVPILVHLYHLFSQNYSANSLIYNTNEVRSSEKFSLWLTFVLFLHHVGRDKHYFFLLSIFYTFWYCFRSR